MFQFDAFSYLQDKAPGEDMMIEFLAKIQREFSEMTISRLPRPSSYTWSWRNYLADVLAECDMEVQEMEQHVARIRQRGGR